MKRLLLFILLFSVISASSVQAVSVQTGQGIIFPVVERGKEATLYLIVHDPSQETLKATSWIRIEDKSEFTLPSGGTVFLRLSINVPKGQEPGEYIEKITYGSTTLATLKIRVVMTSEEVAALVEKADVNKKLSDLENSLGDDMASRLNDLNKGLSAGIKEVSDYQKDVSELEQEIKNLSKESLILDQEVQRLQSSNQELEVTGSFIRSESPVLFFLGVLIGAGGIYLFHRKLHKYL